VQHGFPTREAQTGDNAPAMDYSRAGDLLQFVTYNGRLGRLDGKWELELQWVDLQMDGHRYKLPHEVVHAIITSYERIMKLARSDRAKSGSQTRKAKGIIPFQKAEEASW